MKPIKIYKIYFVLLLGVLFSSCNTKNKKNFIAETGIIDISNHNFNTDGIINLDGEWEFYFGQLLEPKDFKKTQKERKKTFVNVPQSWTRHKEHVAYPEFGCATYRLIIKNKNKNKTIPVLIESQRIFTAYKIWLNGKLLKEIGKVSKSKKDYKPDLKLLLSEPVFLKEENELIIQVSNYDDRRAGILKSIRIGEVNTFFYSSNIELAIIVSVISIILIIGLYHFILFLFQRTEYSNLIFSILAFLCIISGLVGNDTLLKNILAPEFSTITRVFHFAVSLYPAFITLFFYLLFKKEVSKRLLIFVFVVSIVLLITSLFGSISFVRKRILIKIMFLLFVSAYFTFYSLPKAVLNKRQGAIWAFIGMLLLFVANINDILFSLDYIKTRYVAIYGFAAYIIFQSLNIAERFTSSFRRNKRLTEKLRKQNTEYLLLNREYKKQNKELRKAKEEAEKTDRLKSSFLANMSHEIRTPMNAILGFSNLLNNSTLGEEKREELTGYITKSGNSLLHLVNDIIDVSKIEAGQLEINKEECCVNDLFNELENIYDKKNNPDSGSNLKLKFIKKPEREFKLYTDAVRLKQILINLIDNAVKFTEEGLVEVSFTKKDIQKEQFVVFQVKDTGIGLTKEQQSEIFTRFTKIESSGEKLYRGAGLGLSISKNIVNLLGGEIWVESEIQKGSVFYFSIPLNTD